METKEKILWALALTNPLTLVAIGIAFPLVMLLAVVLVSAFYLGILWLALRHAVAELRGPTTSTADLESPPAAIPLGCASPETPPGPAVAEPTSPAPMLTMPSAARMTSPERPVDNLREAMRLIEEEGLSVRGATCRMGVPESTLRRWLKTRAPLSREEDMHNPFPAHRSSGAVVEEVVGDR